MTVIAVTKDADALTMTISARFAAPIERVWELWSDPRQLERWWGPPDYPARVFEHDLRAGGEVTYVLTGEDGDRHGGYWRLRAVEPPRRLEFDDGFADEQGRPDATLPATVVRVRPELVVEIAFDGIQRSPRYPGGVALRFARVVRHRPDKRAEEADTLASVLATRGG